MKLKPDYKKYHNMYGESYIKELELEQESKQEAEKQLQNVLDLAKKEHTTGESKLGGQFAKLSWMDCRHNIDAFIKQAGNRKVTQGFYAKPLEDLVTTYAEQGDKLLDMLTLSTISVMLNFGMMEEDTELKSLSTVAMRIGSTVHDEANVFAFMQEYPKESKNLDVGLNRRVGVMYKEQYIKHIIDNTNYAGISWSPEERKALGAKLLELVVSGSGFFEIVKIRKGLANKEVMCLKCTDWMQAAWTNNENKLVANAVQYKPMIIPPKHWDIGVKGGYYGASTLHTQLVRLKYMNKKSMLTYAKKLNMLDLSIVYDALNAMQDTPFVINKFILNTLQEIVETGGDMCGVPRFEPIDMPPKYPDNVWEKMSEKDKKAHRKYLTGLYRLERSRQGKALRFSMEMKLAEKFSKYEKIYFPWNIDYRGRCYPIATTLSPQGDDIGKSLLLFADAQPIKEEDWKWMAIHGANLAGHDKINFAERQEWIVKHTTDIIASADDPLGYQWWYEESKGDYPLEFLAFCNEWKKLQEYKKTHGKYEGFMSNLPLAFDGTCSGLQHFSALLRDEVGGYAVNLVPSDKVQDIYSIVAEKVNKVLLFDAKCGMGDEPKLDKKTGKPLKDKDGNIKMSYGTKTLAQNWVVFNRDKFHQDGITRKVCKRSVMTLAYGSKQFGFKENLLSDIIKPYCDEHEGNSPFINNSQAAVYMAKLIWNAVQTTVVKAVEGMEWLQKVAQLITKSGEIVTWLTPNNLLVQQNYMKTKKVVSKLRFMHSQVRFYHDEELPEVDDRAQAQGIAPNFIHSLDATHLQRVVVAEKKLGNNNFMMIHDSFGTDASHAGELYKTIRTEFVKLYKDQNHLQNFLDSVSYLISDEYKDKIPAIPKFGKLNLDDVVNSAFCFA